MRYMIEIELGLLIVLALVRLVVVIGQSATSKKCLTLLGEMKPDIERIRAVTLASRLHLSNFGSRQASTMMTLDFIRNAAERAAARADNCEFYLKGISEK